MLSGWQLRIAIIGSHLGLHQGWGCILSMQVTRWSKNLVMLWIMWICWARGWRLLDPLKSENCLGAVVKVPGLRWPVGTLGLNAGFRVSLVPRYSLGPLETATGFCVNCESWPLVFVRLQSFLVQSLWSLVCIYHLQIRMLWHLFLVLSYFFPCLTALSKPFSFEVFPFWCDSGYRFVVYTLYYAEMCSSYFQCLFFF